MRMLTIAITHFMPNLPAVSTWPSLLVAVSVVMTLGIGVGAIVGVGAQAVGDGVQMGASGIQAVGEAGTQVFKSLRT